MKKLVLTLEESRELKETGAVEIERNGFPMLVEVNPYFDENEEENYLNKRYNVTIIDCFDKVVLKKEPKQEQKEKIMVAIFDPKKMHIYDCKTSGKRPVRLVDGGEYITQSESGKFDEGGDMGWYYINQKEFEYMQSQMVEATINEKGYVVIL